MIIGVGSLVVLATLMSGPDAAGPPASMQDKPATTTTSGEAAAIRRVVKEGQKVRVTDDQGREWQGRIAELAPDTLVLVTKDRQRSDLPYAAILKIDRSHDGLGNGAMIGFLSGAAVGLLAVLSEESAECEPGAFFSCGDPAAGAYALVPAVFGAVGAGIGVGIDALIRKDPNLFRRGSPRVAVAPAFGGGVRGLRVSVRW